MAMWSRHVSRNLSAFCHGELDPRASARVSSHVETCARCRAELAEIERGIDLATRTALARGPATMWPWIVGRTEARDDAAVLRGHAGSGASAGHAASWTRRLLVIPAAVAALLLIGVGLSTLWTALRPAKAWPVASLGGSIHVGGEPIADRAMLALDGRVETGEAARATIGIGRIGQVEVEPNSAVRLVGTGWVDHRLSLERGSIRATIFAPPRVFFVSTPSAIAVDLGCAFSLTVDERGETTIHVTSGWVALEDPRRQVFVPAGAACRARPDSGPGTPYFDDAPPDLVDALDPIDRGGAAGAAEAALGHILATARPRDTLTLWHLLGRVGVADRARVYDRLAALSPPPEGVARDRVLTLDRETLDRWRRTFDPPWNVESPWRGGWRNLWSRVLGSTP